MAMTSDTAEREQLLRIARLRYEAGLSQRQIAEELGVSGSTISRALKRARDLGLIEVRIAPGALRDTALERALIERWDLALAVVVDADPVAAEVRRRLGEALARVLADRIAPGDVLGVSDGETTAAIAAAARRPRAGGVDVVPLLGGIGVPQAPSHPNAVCRLMAERLGGQAWELPVPVLMNDGTAAQVIRDTTAVRGVLGRMAEVTLALVGVGAISGDAPMVQSGAFAPADMAEAARLGAAGSICARFYDAMGRPVRSALDERTVAIRLDDLARVATRIAVAVGPAKAPALVAALRGRLANAVGTDTETARLLLDAG